MRISWEQYALDIAEVAATRSEDPYLKVGAVILRPDNSVASIGYNGGPAGIDLQWHDREGRRKYVIHAEANAFRYVKLNEVKDGLIAVTHRPCQTCLPQIAAYGIKNVYYKYEIDNDTYPVELLDNIANELQLNVKCLKGENNAKNYI